MLLNQPSMPDRIEDVLKTFFCLDDFDHGLVDMIWEKLFDALTRTIPDVEFDGMYKPTDLRHMSPDDINTSLGLGSDHQYILRHNSNGVLGVEHQFCYPVAFIFVEKLESGKIEATLFDDDDMVVPMKTVCHGFHMADVLEEKLEYTADGNFLGMCDCIEAATKKGNPFVIFKAMIGTTTINVEKRFLHFFKKKRHILMDEVGFLTFTFSVSDDRAREILEKEKGIQDDAYEEDDDDDEDDGIPTLTSAMLGVDTSGDGKDDDKNENMMVVVSSNTEELPPPDIIEQIPLPPSVKKKMLEAWNKKHGGKNPKASKKPKKQLPDMEDKREIFLNHLNTGIKYLHDAQIKDEYIQESVANIRSYLRMENIFNNLTLFRVIFGGDQDWSIGYMTELYESEEDTFTRFCSQYSFRKEGKPVNLKIKKVQNFLDRDDHLIGFMKQKKDTFTSAVFLECTRNPKDWFDCSYTILWVVFSSQFLNGGTFGGDQEMKKLEARNNGHFYI